MCPTAITTPGSPVGRNRTPNFFHYWTPPRLRPLAPERDQRILCNERGPTGRPGGRTGDKEIPLCDMKRARLHEHRARRNREESSRREIARRNFFHYWTSSAPLAPSPLNANQIPSSASQRPSVARDNCRLRLSARPVSRESGQGHYRIRGRVREPGLSPSRSERFRPTY
jgi:hypothetical protein